MPHLRHNACPTPARPSTVYPTGGQEAFRRTHRGLPRPGGISHPPHPLRQPHNFRRHPGHPRRRPATRRERTLSAVPLPLRRVLPPARHRRRPRERRRRGRGRMVPPQPPPLMPEVATGRTQRQDPAPGSTTTTPAASPANANTIGRTTRRAAHLYRCRPTTLPDPLHPASTSALITVRMVGHLSPRTSSANASATSAGLVRGRVRGPHLSSPPTASAPRVTRSS